MWNHTDTLLLEGRQSIFFWIEIVYILRGSDYILHEKSKVIN